MGGHDTRNMSPKRSQPPRLPERLKWLAILVARVGPVLMWYEIGESTFLQARVARQCGDTTAARKPIADCLRELPGDQDFAPLRRQERRRMTHLWRALP